MLRHCAASILQNGVRWTVNGYYNDYTDYTFENPTGQFIPAEDGEEFQLFEYLQGDAKFYGFEAEVGFPLWQQGEDHLELRLASDYVRGKLDNGGDLPNIPPLRVGAGLHYDLGQWHLGTQVFYYDKQDKIAANELLTDGYTMVNADTSYRLTICLLPTFIL